MHSQIIAFLLSKIDGGGLIFESTKSSGISNIVILAKDDTTSTAFLNEIDVIWFYLRVLDYGGSLVILIENWHIVT